MATDKNFVIKNGLTINGSEVITSAGNLTNIGTISSGAITSTGTIISNQGTPTGSIIGGIRAYGGSNAYMSAADGSGRTAFFGVDSSGYAMFGALTNHDVVLRANNSEKLRAKVNSDVQITSGNLQMGTTTVIDSSRNLTNIGTISSGKISTSFSSSHTTSTISHTNAALDLYNPLEANTDEKGTIITFSDNYFDGTNYIKTTRAAIKGGTDTVGNTADGYLAFYTDNGGANSANERLRIDKDGNFNFKTGNFSNIGTISSGAITADSTGTNTVTIDGTGSFTLRSYHDSGGVGWATGSGASFNNLLYLDDSNDFVRIYSGQAERARFNSSGIDARSGGFRINGTTVIDSSRNLTDIGTISSGMQTVTYTGSATPANGATGLRVIDSRTAAADVGGSISLTGAYNGTTLLGQSPYIRAYKANGSQGDYSFGLKFGIRKNGVGTAAQALQIDEDKNATFAGALNIGAAIGSRATTLSIEGDSDSGPFAVKCSGKATVFSVLPWTGGETYIASGAYYDDGSWVHASADTTNCLLKLDGSGVSWYSSNNSSGSWNVASDVSLWNSSGSWIGGIASSGYNNSNWDTAYSWGNHASAGYQTAGTTSLSNYLRKNQNDTLSSTLKVTGSIIHEFNTAGGYIARPKGAQYVTSTNAHTGAIKIKLPTHGTDDMMSFWVDIYDYSTGESVTLWIGGYLYQTTGNNEWVNTTALIFTEQTGKAPENVRFGADGSNNCVWIGETTDTWSYPQVIVRDFQCGYSADVDAYDDNWAISFVTSFDTVDETHVAKGPVTEWDRVEGKPTIPTNNNQLTNGAGYITSFDITTQTDPKYLRSDANDTFTGTLTTGELQIFSNHPVHTGYSGIANTQAWTTTTQQYMIISAGTDTYINGDVVYIRAGNNSSSNEMKISTSGTTIGGNTVWHAGNDGSGSTLDADKLDGAEGAVYFKSPSNVSGWQNSDANFSVRSGSNAVGLHMEESDGTFGFQLYGDSGYYGFLDGEWANWDIQKLANGAFKVDEGAGLKRVLNEANWSTYVTSVSGTSGGLSGSPNITVGTITSGTIDSSGTSNFDNIQLTDTSKLGFGTVKSGATVGHTASVDEGIFWHTSNDYAIYRTAGTWSSPNYQQLKLKWATGIELDGNGTSYGKSGINFLNGNIKMDGTQILDSSRNLRNIPLQNLGATQAGSEHAVINIGRQSSGETRAIDIIGSWSSGENKSISAVHGSSSTNLVGQINFIHDSPGSRMRFGKLYDSGDSSAYPMTLDSNGTSYAFLNVNGGQHSTGNANRTFGTAASRKTRGAFHIKGGEGGTNGSASVTGITFPGNSENEAQAGLYCSQNSQTGTSLSLMCTDSYANGPKEYFSVLDSGYCKVMSNTLDVYDQVYASTKGSQYLIMGDAAYSTSSAYIGMKTSFQSGVNDYMIISGVSDGDTYVSAKNGGAVHIRGGGNYSSNQIYVPDGTTITATTTDFRCTGNVTAYASDERLKTNIQVINNAIEKVQQIRGVTFDWIDEIEDKGFYPLHKTETGVIAQDIQKVLPDATPNAPFNEEYLTVNHDKIIPLLIEAVKEQQKQIEKLKEEVSSLRSKN